MKIVPHTLSSRAKRHRRVRATVIGTPARPRLNVFRSLNHIYAQVIDDSTGHTMAAAGTLDKDLRGQDGTKTADAKAVGKLVAERALQAGVKQVVFDRGGYQYHGRVKALAEAAREAGLDF
ncbi:MAG TPA: 50S ribosomal protein L18 [Chloroflexia bacterium]|nr:50S ribosomal protein L18 [Chloroflexia bacterium]